MVNLRIGLFLYPPYMDKDEKGEPTGMKMYVRGYNLVKNIQAQKGYNLTAVYSEGANFGKYENGTYDGIFGLTYNDKADVLMVSCGLETYPPPGKFGPVIFPTDVRIYTMVNPSIFQPVDFLSCFNVFDTVINSLIMLALVSIGFLLVKHYKLRAFLVLLSNALLQSFSAVEALGFLPHLSMLMGILLVRSLHGSLYSTSAWIEIAPKQVDTVEDLLSQGKEPLFAKTAVEPQLFKHGITRNGKKVWKVVERLGVSKCLIDPGEFLQMFSNGEFTTEKAIIILSYYDTFLGVFGCQFYGKRFEKGGRMHASQPVHSSVTAAVRNSRLKASEVQVVDNVFYDLFEFGYIQNIMDDYRKNPPIDTTLVQTLVSPDCRREIFKAKALNEEESEIKLTLKDFGQALTLFFGTLIVLSALFLIEYKRIH